MRSTNTISKTDSIPVVADCLVDEDAHGLLRAHQNY